MKLSGKGVVSKGSVAKVAASVALWELMKLGYRKLGELSSKQQIAKLHRENELLRALLEQSPEPESPVEHEMAQPVKDKSTRRTGT